MEYGSHRQQRSITSTDGMGIIADLGCHSKTGNFLCLKQSYHILTNILFSIDIVACLFYKQIEDDEYSEIYLNYYDIFVRNAFGNYFDILKEVSYSPMMAEMLSYLDSKSSAWVLQEVGSKSSPGERYIPCYT